MKKYFLLMIAIILVVAISLVYLSKPIKVGFVAGLSGSSSNLGVEGMYGAMLAVEEINENGGIHNRQLELIIKDDKNDVLEALKVDKELIEEGCKVIIGHMISSVSKDTVPLMNEEKILMLSPTIATDYLSEKDDYFIRMISSNLEQAKLLAEALEKNKAEKVNMIFMKSNKLFSESIMDYLMKSTANNTVKIEGVYQIDKKTDYIEMIEDMGRTGPDSLVIIASAEEVAYISQLLSINNINIQVYMPTWSMTNDLLKNGGASIEGNIGVNYFDYNASNKKYEKFKTNYISKYGNEPSFASMFSYEAVLILKEALQKNKKYNADILKNGIIDGTEFEGLQNTLYFDQYGDINRNISTYKIIDGEFIRWN